MIATATICISINAPASTASWLTDPCTYHTLFSIRPGCQAAAAYEFAYFLPPSHCGYGQTCIDLTLNNVKLHCIQAPTLAAALSSL